MLYKSYGDYNAAPSNELTCDHPNRDLLVTQQARRYTHEFLWFPMGRQGCGDRSYRRPHRGPMVQRVPCIYLGPRAPKVPIEPYGATGNHVALIGP